jgi:hypothetical protein
MDVIDSLILISESTSLDAYLLDNGQKIFDSLFLSEYHEIEPYAGRINNFYSTNSRMINELDLSKKHNSAFILMIADFLERFDYSSSFNSIIRLCNRKSINISYRLKASSLFLSSHIHYNIEYLNIYEEILSLLNTAYKTEEDDVSLVTYTFSNYFHKVVNDTYQYDLNVAAKLQGKIILSQQSNLYYFLDNDVIRYITKLDLNKYSEKESLELQLRISNCICERKNQPLYETYAPISECIISTGLKENTEYATLLSTAQPNFKSIRDLSVQKSKQIPNENLIRNSMGRGTSILVQDEQLYLYLRDYGNMHKAKLDSVLNTLNKRLDNKSIEVIDWGAGQALACMVFFDFLNSISLLTTINQVILIEPSELCITRGVLHIEKYNRSNRIRTVKKELDNVSEIEVATSQTSVKIHLFSNILDVENFSIFKLINLIEKTQKGANYFVCVSPYITDNKAERVDSFKRYFQNNYTSFELLASVNTSGRLEDKYWNCNNNYNGNLGKYCNHPECGCQKKWTRVIRVFKVEI